ncbi:hypothetical protein [Absidia glauca]|uniref:Uncharacterized protein n=1 Tax=Absidia glauca TaxID=4829 RepID=A0A168MTN9_ABSGL|nr:hypothetical protein [Absidia glauca]
MSFGSPCSAPSSPILLGHPSWSALLGHDSLSGSKKWTKWTLAEKVPLPFGIPPSELRHHYRHLSLALALWFRPTTSLP